MTEIDIKKIKQRLEIRNQERYARLTQQQQLLLRKLKECIPELEVRFPSVSKLVVFGSLAMEN